MPIIFPLTGNEPLALALAPRLVADMGNATLRHFPDGESYVKVNDRVEGKEVILVCTLDYPDGKLLPLYFLAMTLKEMGALRVGLVAPYLSYMRQDKRFAPGESVTSTHFGKLLSGMVDWLVTIDPHLHRHSSLGEVYSIPTQVVHAAPGISNWIRENVNLPVLIGPDTESEQWVSEIAEAAGAPYVVFQKERKGDRHVLIHPVDMSAYSQHTPVLVDDIVSTARTMTATVQKLREMGLSAPICIGVHGIFAGDAYQELQLAGPSQILTCNTVLHESNAIDLTDDLAQGIEAVLSGTFEQQKWYGRVT